MVFANYPATKTAPKTQKALEIIKKFACGQSS